MKISIITTTYNDKKNLETIIQHVKKQNYPDIEHSIVDGESKDGTLEVIKKYKEENPEKVFYVSEKDSGIYDAINKGIKMATGDIIGCCFDEYVDDNVLTKIANHIEKDDSDGVHADLCYMQNGKVIRYWKQGQGRIQDGWLPAHPTLYLKKEIYEKYGLYKTDYRISADYEFMVRILKDNQVKLSYINEVLINMAYGGTSSNGLKAYIESWREGHRALKENNVRHPWIIDFKRVIRVLKQFITAKTK